MDFVALAIIALVIAIVTSGFSDAAAAHAEKTEEFERQFTENR